MDTVTRDQILAKVAYISYSTTSLGKGMNPIILPPAINSWALSSLTFLWQLIQEKENTDFKNVVLYPASAE